MMDNKVFDAIDVIGSFCASRGSCDGCKAYQGAKLGCVFMVSPPYMWKPLLDVNGITLVSKLLENEEGCKTCKDYEKCSLEAELHKLDIGLGKCDRYVKV